jgi:uncharacterized repeat protein (TIGR03843 family)
VRSGPDSVPSGTDPVLSDPDQVQPGPGPALAGPDAIDLLSNGTMEIEGRLTDASNTTLRAVITLDDVVARCVYKPVRGERPLWDFPNGTLAGREFGAYLVSEAVGWGIVPPTVLRVGPLGEGMCQLWIDEDRQRDDPLVAFVPRRRVPAGWYRVASAQDETGRPYTLAHSNDPALARMALFDVVVNNADRKGGHVLGTVDGEVYGVDHGVCFHTDDKLRTVLWGWAEKPVPDEAAEDLTRLRSCLDGPLAAALAEHLTRAEIKAVRTRTAMLLRRRCYPQPSPGWPALPWPPI